MSKITKELLSENKRLKNELCKAACELHNLREDLEDDYEELQRQYESVCAQFLKELKKSKTESIIVTEEDFINDRYNRETIRKYKETFRADRRS